MDALCLGLGMKFCSKCNTKKNETDFHKCKNSKDGLTYYCKECNSKSARDWAKNNPEKIVQRQKNTIKNIQNIGKKVGRDNMRKILKRIANDAETGRKIIQKDTDNGL
tara:strand:- start:75 stop:398 length:324 start_codon:yes stop_codon:yes gene_type:complete